MAGYLERGMDAEEIEPKSGRVAGRISANLRWTSMIDPQHLVELLAGGMGHEKAADDLIVLEVPAGTHYLYFSGRQDLFQETVGNEFNCSELPLGDFELPPMALTQAPLAPKARRRPSGF